MSSTRTAHDAPPGTSMPRRHVLLVFWGLMLAGLMSSLDATILGTALPTIVTDLGGLDRIAWVMTAYVLANGVTVPLSGRLGDLFGRKPVFVIAIVCFLAGSVACGLAPTMGWLIAFRVAQGAGAGGLLATMFALTGDLFEPRERARYQGYGALVFAVSSIAGPLLGGALTEHASWRWVFFVNLPLGAVALGTTLAFLRLPRPTGRPRIDYPGIVTLGAAITAVTLLTGWAGTRDDWDSPVIIGLAIGSALLFTAWVLIERRATEPVIPPRLFTDRSFVIACAVALVGGATGFGLATYLPMYLQVVDDVSVTASGLWLLPMMVGLLVSSMGAGRLIARTGRYRWLPAASMGVGAAGVALLATMTTTTSVATVGGYMAVLGFGAGLSQQVVMLIAQNAAPTRDLGAATSGVFAARMVGTAAGMAVFGSVLTNRFAHEIGTRLAGAGGLPRAGEPTPEAVHALPAELRGDVAEAYAHAFTAVFLVALPLLVAGLIVAVGLPNRPLRGRG